MIKRRWVFLLLLVTLVFIGYSSYLGGDFVLDDEALILNSPAINGQKTLAAVFSTSIYYHKPFTYRPLQELSNIIDYKVWGYNPFGFHLTNIIIHLINAILIFYFFSLILPLGLAQVTSILFAVHPINTSVVGFVSGRADLLVLFFMLLSIISILKFTNSKLKVYYLLSLFFGFLAFFCRENSLILCLLIFLVISLNKVKPRRAFLLSAPFLALSLTYVILYAMFSNAVTIGFFPTEMSLLFVIINFLSIITKYLLILILPLNLHMFRSSEFILTFFDIRALIGVVFFIFCLYIIYRFRRHKVFLFGVLWFLISLIPVLFLLNKYLWLKKAMMAESWLYIPVLGFFLLFAICLNKFAQAGKLVFFLYVILCLYLTYQQHIYWKDNIVAYTSMMRYLPENNPVRQNLIRAYLKRGFYAEARVELNKFSRAYPESSVRYVLEGDYYYAIKEFDESKNSYKKALILNWKNPAVIKKLQKIEAENGK